MKAIPVFRPSYGEEELALVKEVFDSAWIGLGPKTQLFEERFADYVGTKYACAVNSATAGLHLALEALGVGPDDEVISPSLTFVSTNHAILYNGATVVFGDVCEDTLTLDPQDVRRKVTRKTKGIIAMHYGGHPCDVDALQAIADEHGLFILEDAAHACGSVYKGRKAGSLGDVACFSFHAVKNLATGDGGMVTTDHQDIYERSKCMRWVGIDKDTWKRSGKQRYSWYYDVTDLGFKYHMNDIIAAIGLAQLAKLERLNDRRREIAARYNKAFADVPWLQTPVEKPGVKSACHNYVIRAKDRDNLIAHLKELGVSCGMHYIPNHHYAMYASFRSDVPVTEAVWKKLVTLPLYPDMDEDDIRRVIAGVRSFEPA